MVIATAEEIHNRAIDLIGKGGVARILKHNHEAIVSTWQDVFNKTPPKQGSRQRADKFVFLGVVIVAVLDGRWRTNVIKFINNGKELS